MKIINSIILMLFVLGAPVSFAQISDKDWEYLLVREDVVKPSMTVYYEASLTDLASFLILLY